ncbi:unnamed protein product [Allacma fusca]|uniref:Uncharacterized protein n=1 Tax=Allacma fusca TaxID=39272 RepID=A0A8J2K7C0_9HEXA|nr:unnamed protein product [Allacma fusca]
MEICKSFAMGRPQLRKLSFSSYWWYWPQEFLEPVVDILQVMAESSSGSLEELTSDQLNLIWLTNSGLSFPRVTKLTVRYDRNVDERERYSSLHKIDFNRLFPNLQTVQLWGEHVYVEDLSLFNAESFRNSKDYFASPCKVKDLKISHARFWEMHTFQCFGTVFPHVQNLYFESSHRIDYCLPLLWNTWENIESINIDTRDVLAEENLDSLFCGISREEADEICKESSDFLRQYQFAPIRPSLSNLKQLKSLRLNVSHSLIRCRDRGPNSSMLSNTTGTLVSASQLTIKLPNGGLEAVCYLSAVPILVLK